MIEHIDLELVKLYKSKIVNDLTSKTQKYRYRNTLTEFNKFHFDVALLAIKHSYNIK